ncbi:hypothetical protein Y1Q_0015457 [Alligator mississippiensis]|uniref:Uncharacterized protein n=1 Tax=Alligator mississippiensis TaxID=8496 RepID=A0A151NDF7_ALLMI|nr:hypothetical protein Y1Q_0015457 [Alligator mississippiensis]
MCTLRKCGVHNPNEKGCDRQLWVCMVFNQSLFSGVENFCTWTLPDDVISLAHHLFDSQYVFYGTSLITDYVARKTSNGDSHQETCPYCP